MSIEILPLPADAGLVPVTPEEEARWMMIHGQILILTRGGVRYRVVEPWETGEAP